VAAQLEAHVLAQVQWVKQSAVKQLLALEFHTGVQMGTKPNLLLLKMAQLKSLLNGIVLAVVIQLVETKINRHHLLKMSRIKLTWLM
jgi:hypothetical protein